MLFDGVVPARGRGRRHVGPYYLRPSARPRPRTGAAPASSGLRRRHKARHPHVAFVRRQWRRAEDFGFTNFVPPLLTTGIQLRPKSAFRETSSAVSLRNAVGQRAILGPSVPGRMPGPLGIDSKDTDLSSNLSPQTYSMSSLAAAEHNSRPFPRVSRPSTKALHSTHGARGPIARAREHAAGARE